MHILAFALVLATFVVSLPLAQNDDSARGLYIGSRPKVSTRVPARPPNPGSKAPKPAPPRAKPTDPVGLGFSLYKVLDTSTAVRADASAMFRDGELLRFVLEPSVDGYLYVFVSTNGGPAVMVYPDYRLEEGDNFVYAHTVAEVPSRRNPAFNVFKVVDGPATENVTFVVSRTPLPNVPVGDELVRYCRTGTCPWSPDAALWSSIASRAGSGTRVSTKPDTGTAISRVEENALNGRGLQLGSSDPAPSVVAVNASADAQTLVHRVSIRHQ